MGRAGLNCYDIGPKPRGGNETARVHFAARPLGGNWPFTATRRRSPWCRSIDFWICCPKVL